MKLSTIFIMVLSLLMIIVLSSYEKQPPYPFTEEEELNLRLEALELLEGDPEEIKEEAYFKTLI